MENYNEYLQSEHWKILRRKALERDMYRCCSCKTYQNIQVHHKFYRENLLDSLPEDLETLCEYCHCKKHGIETDFKPLSDFNKQYQPYKERHEAYPIVDCSNSLNLIKKGVPWKAIRAIAKKAAKKNRKKMPKYLHPGRRQYAQRLEKEFYGDVMQRTNSEKL